MPPRLFALTVRAINETPNTYEKCVFKDSGRLPFNLFIINQCCVPNFLLRNYCMSSKQVKGCKYIII